MQTGYDNYWMYHNNRHEPVHNLQKNDNYICPVLPDNYKQMQNGGYPNRISTHVNKVPSSQNGMYSTGPHCMWPSPMFSMPFNSSCANNFHPQVFPAQSNNIRYPSQTSQPKTGLRNSDVSVFQNNKGNNPKPLPGRLPQIGNCNDTETARIRVKDVYTLNNNSMYSSVIDNDLVQNQKNKQYKYPLNYAASNCNRTCDFEANLPASNHLPSSYVQREQQNLVNQQQFLQYSGGLYHQEAQIPSENHVQSNSNKQRESNTHLKGFKPRSLLMNLLRSNENQNDVQNDFSNALDGTRTAVPQAKRKDQLNSKTVNYHDSSQLNEKSPYESSHNNSYAVENRNQINYSNIDQSPSLRQYPSEDLRSKQLCEQGIPSNVSGFSNNRINGVGNNMVKITVPHTGQSTFINPVEPDIRERNTRLSLPSLLDSPAEVYNDETNENNTRHYIQDDGSHPHSQTDNNQVRQKSCNPSPNRNLPRTTPPGLMPSDHNSNPKNTNCNYRNSVITSPRNLVTAQRYRQESLDNVRRQESQEVFQNLKHSSESVPENFNSHISDGSENASNESSNDTELISLNEDILGNVTVKQEMFTSGGDNATVQKNHDLTIGNVCEHIKVEDQTEDFEEEPSPSKNTGCRSSNSGNYGAADVEQRLVNKKNGSESEIKSVGQENTQNGCSKSENSGKNTNKKDSSEQAQKIIHKKPKKFPERRSYKCEINRDKLDLLIQFLKKDDEVIISKISDDNDPAEKPHEECKSKKYDVSTHSRRKLNKIHIVKNKNNTREMVSMISTKTRGENIDSPKRSQNTKSEEVKKSYPSDPKINDNRVDVKSVTCQQKQKEFESESVTKGKNTTAKRDPQESFIDEEKNIANIMQVLKNLKSHFCLSCTLVSPIESFWINVVSGELRCLSCFKKLVWKTDENAGKLKGPSGNYSSVTEPDKIKKEREKKVECFSENSDGSKEETAKSVNESTKKRNSEERSLTSKHKNTEVRSATTRKEKDEKSNTSKEDIEYLTKILEDPSEPGTKIRRKSSLREESIPDKTHNVEEASITKSRRKSTEDHHIIADISSVSHSKFLSDFFEKKNSAREEMGSPKNKVQCDNLKKERKLSSPPVGKCSKEHSVSHKTSSSKECLETKSNSEKEEDVVDFERKDKKQHKDSMQNRKRADSKEENGCQKIRISEEEIISVETPSEENISCQKYHTGEVGLKRNTTESLDKSKIQNHSKGSCTSSREKELKHVKPKHSRSLDDSDRKSSHGLEKGKSSEKEDQARKRRQSMEEIFPHKIRVVEDYSKDVKFTKHSFDRPKIVSKPEDKISEHHKHHSPDLTSMPRRKSKDEGIISKEQSKREIRNCTESSDKERRNSISKENLEDSKNEERHESSVSKKSHKEKKYFLDKIPKSLHRSSEKDNFEVKKSSKNDGKTPELDSKPLKESQRAETEVLIPTAAQILKKREIHEYRHNHKEVPDGKVMEKKKNKNMNPEVGDNIDEKKPTEHHHKRIKSQTVRHSKKERALECIFGRKKEDSHSNEYRKTGPENPHSTKLLEKLIEKTKKLSWTLLGEP